jgi:hypothetical protein
VRALRSMLTSTVLVLGLAGCGSEECSLPRSGDEQSCDSYDGGQWTFVAGEPFPDLSAYCASKCVDVFAPVAIGGYDDLRRVPLLSKLRVIQRLRVNMDGLKDLRGLEAVDVTGHLTLFGQNGDGSPKTLDGLSDEEMEGFSVEQVSGLATLESASVKRVDSLSVMGSSVQHLDLTGIQASYVSVLATDELRSLSFAAGEMKQVIIRGNGQLSELSWTPGTTVRNQLVVEFNDALSSCLVQQFVEQTDAGVRRTEFIRNNGPCP